jgi:hypothetical protein
MKNKRLESLKKELPILQSFDDKNYPNMKAHFISMIDRILEDHKKEGVNIGMIFNDLKEYEKVIIGFIAHRNIGTPDEIKDTTFLDLWNNFNANRYSDRIFLLALIVLLSKNEIKNKFELTDKGIKRFWDEMPYKHE